MCFWKYREPIYSPHIVLALLSRGIPHSYSNQRDKSIAKLTRLAVNNRRFDGRAPESPAALANQVSVIPKLQFDWQPTVWNLHYLCLLPREYQEKNMGILYATHCWICMFLVSLLDPSYLVSLWTAIIIIVCLSKVKFFNYSTMIPKCLNC